MNAKDKTNTLARYNESHEKFGISPKSLGWGGGKERQWKRFRAALDFSNFDNRPIRTLLDVGCGFGDLGAWLIENNSTIEYSGIDINPALVDAGRKRYDLDLSLTDINSVAENSYDLVVANGIFNYQLKHENHKEYICRMLNRFMEIARIGIAVDFMSTYVDFVRPGTFHCPEALVVDVIKTQTKRFVIRNDYMDYEYIVYAYL